MEELNKNKYIKFTIVAVVSLLIGGGIGFYYAFYVGNANLNNCLSASNMQNTTQQNHPSASQQDITMPTEINVIGGAIKSISGDKIELTVNQRVFPFKIANRTVLLNNKTEVMKFTKKDPDVYKKEIDAFMKKINSSSASDNQNTKLLKSPVSYTETKASVSDLSGGTLIVAFTKENIKDDKTFTAYKIGIVDESMFKASVAAQQPAIEQ